MAGYLDQYGAGVEERHKKIKRLVVTVLCVLVAAGIAYYLFHNYREEQRGKQFLALLQARDYKGAYALFGCTDTKPCTAYEFRRFMEDWGPNSEHANAANASVKHSRSCGSGVLLTMDFGGKPEELWVERKNMTVGFPPFNGCPGLQRQ